MERSSGAADHPVVATSRARTPRSCYWGASTLLQTFPEWLSAWDTPWSCRHPAHTGPLETSDMCLACPDWRRLPPPDGGKGPEGS